MGKSFLYNALRMKEHKYYFQAISNQKGNYHGMGWTTTKYALEAQANKFVKSGVCELVRE